jgi:hypothetical protein
MGGITFEVLPLKNYALIPPMLPLLGTFPELLLWNSFQCPHFFCGGGGDIFQYPETFVPLRHILLLETARMLDSMPCELEHYHWGESNWWAKHQASHSFKFPHNKLRLTVWPCGMNL